MLDPVYILIRTSGRPEYFKKMMETIKKQTYKNIVTIVHSDDPRDQYVCGDIIINGTAYGPGYGNATYNLYNNRLLRAIPRENPGWYHFIDDDDEYFDENVIENLVKNSQRDCINVGHVIRWNNTIWPRNWKEQKSYQTECFFLHTDHRLKAKWWGHRGGDHNYSKQLTKILEINWIDNLIICRAQEGKGNGKKLDKGGAFVDYSNAIEKDEKIVCLGLLPHRKGKRNEWIVQGELKRIKYETAYRLEQNGIVKITHYNSASKNIPVRNIYKI